MANMAYFVWKFDSLFPPAAWSGDGDPGHKCQDEAFVWLTWVTFNRMKQ